MIKKVIKFCAVTYKESKEYINENKDEIIERNALILKKVSLIYTVILSGYFIMAFNVFKSKIFNSIYISFLVLQIIFDIIVRKTLKNENSLGFKTVQFLCFCFDLFVISFVILISIYPLTNDPSIYFAPAIICLSVLFAFPIEQKIGMLSGFCIVFYILAAKYKTPYSFLYDSSATVEALILGIATIYIIHNITIRENNIKTELKYLSITDGLTGTSNKSTTEYLCKSYFEQKLIHETFALFVIDVDNFKQVNDTLGHTNGDRVLKKVGEILTSTFNKADIVGRIGGDEFVVLMKNYSDYNSINRKANNIQNQVRNIFSEMLENKLSCSIGVIAGNNKDKTYKELFIKADKALYQAKTEGKERCIIYQEPSLKSGRATKPYILIGDNNEISRAILNNILKQEYTVIEAKNGEEVFNLMNNYKEVLRVVLMNIKTLNGINILKKVSNDNEISNIPILAITTEEENKLRMIELGVAGLITTPFDKENVKDEVYRVQKIAE